MRQVGAAGPSDCVGANGCVIPVVAYRPPRLSGARMFLVPDGRPLFEIKAG